MEAAKAMAWSRALFLASLLVGVAGQAAQAADDGSGPLPKGHEESAAEQVSGGAADAAAQAAAAVKAQSATKKPVRRRNCFLDLTNPPGGNGHFAPSGRAFYLLAQTGTAETSAASRKHHKKRHVPPKIKYTLYRINPQTRRSEALLSFDQRGQASLITYGDPAAAISGIAFIGRTAGCYAGAAQVLTVSFKRKEDRAERTTGHFQLVETPTGRMLVDQKKSAIVEMDPSTFQLRISRRVTKGDRPLYFDPAKKLLVTWRDDGKQRGLVVDDGQDVKRLGFRANDRVVQQGGRFAVAHLDANANTIELTELPDWTKVEKAARFKLEVPPAYPVSSAGITVNFDKHLALVYGANFLAKKNWQRVFVYDYGKGELLGAVPVTGSEYLNYAGIDPTGAYAIVEVRDEATRRTLSGKIFNVAKKSFDDLDFVKRK